jgi:hypothetical protein
MNILRLEGQQNSAETAVFCGDARNISNVDINRITELVFLKNKQATMRKSKMELEKYFPYLSVFA